MNNLFELMPKITHISQLDFSKTYNYADYLTWQLDEICLANPDYYLDIKNFDSQNHN